MSQPEKMKIAIIGSGISGMSAAWLLAKQCDITLYEKDDRIGGHSNTVQLPVSPNNPRQIGIDTGFIVFNDRNYPNLVALLDHLDVASHATDMSFSVSRNQGEFEYAGSSLQSLFAQRKNLVSPDFWRMLRDIKKFYQKAPELLSEDIPDDMTLGDYLDQNHYSDIFKYDHLLPMGAAIWSTPMDQMLAYPLSAFLNFCHNHGLLQIRNRPTWRSIIGGSQSYIDKITASYKDNIRLNAAVTSVFHTDNGIIVEDRHGDQARYDHVVFASHPDQTLDMIQQPTQAERDCLSAFSYQPNIAILHTDTKLMPQRRQTWSSWNYLSDTNPENTNICVTYWMNCLQKLETQTDYFVTLNPTEMPDQHKIIRSFLYHHPLFNADTLKAQHDIWQIQGKRGLWFCGAYLGHGFHEDGLQSGLTIAEKITHSRRPWQTDRAHDRLYMPAHWMKQPIVSQNFHKESA